MTRERVQRVDAQRTRKRGEGIVEDHRCRRCDDVVMTHEGGDRAFHLRRRDGVAGAVGVGNVDALLDACAVEPQILDFRAARRDLALQVRVCDAPASHGGCGGGRVGVIREGRERIHAGCHPPGSRVGRETLRHVGDLVLCGARCAQPRLERAPRLDELRRFRVERAEFRSRIDARLAAEQLVRALAEQLALRVQLVETGFRDLRPQLRALSFRGGDDVGRLAYSEIGVSRSQTRTEQHQVFVRPCPEPAEQFAQLRVEGRGIVAAPEESATTRVVRVAKRFAQPRGFGEVGGGDAWRARAPLREASARFRGDELPLAQLFFDLIARSMPSQRVVERFERAGERFGFGVHRPRQRLGVRDRGDERIERRFARRGRAIARRLQPRRALLGVGELGGKRTFSRLERAQHAARVSDRFVDRSELCSEIIARVARMIVEVGEGIGPQDRAGDAVDGTRQRPQRQPFAVDLDEPVRRLVTPAQERAAEPRGESVAEPRENRDVRVEAQQGRRCRSAHHDEAKPRQCRVPLLARRDRELVRFHPCLRARSYGVACRRDSRSHALHTLVAHPSPTGSRTARTRPLPAARANCLTTSAPKDATMGG